MENKIQIRKMHLDLYNENKDVLKKKVHYTKNSPEMREITLITKVKSVKSQEIMM